MIDFTIEDFAINQRPPVTLPLPSFYQSLGEEGIRKMVSDQYDLLAKSQIKGLFPPNKEAFEQAKKHSADFFVQICGGQAYYSQNRGNPMLIKRHAAFSITAEARIVWLNCYIEVLSKLDMEEEALISFWTYLNVFSVWMINSEKEMESKN